MFFKNSDDKQIKAVLERLKNIDDQLYEFSNIISKIQASINRLNAKTAVEAREKGRNPTYDDIMKDILRGKHIIPLDELNGVQSK